MARCHQEVDVCPAGVQLPGVCPATQVKIEWDVWLTEHLVIPLIVQFVLTVLFMCAFRPLYTWAFDRKYSAFKQCMMTYVGTKDNKEVPNGWFMVLVFSLQLCASLNILGTYIWNVYLREVQFDAQIQLTVGAAINVLTYIVNRLQGGMSVASHWELNSLADILTLTPTLVQAADLQNHSVDTCQPKWLSLHYLRAYSLLHAFMQLRATGMLKHSGVMVQMIILAILRIGCLIFVMSGTIFTLEILGDPTMFADNFIQTPAGDNISFLQMVYWIVISLTTVGYGDFAPRTLISRLVTSIFIVVGVGYIFWVQFQFQEAWKSNREGCGAYSSRSTKDHHVVVVLNHRGEATTLASVVKGFLDEILHSSHSKKWPNIVFFSPTKWDADEGHTFNGWLREKGYKQDARDKIWWIVGNITSKKDMDRCAIGTSTLTFLVPYVNTATPDRDDEMNIFASVVIRDHFPKVRLRLMLLRPQSKELAIQSGIEMSRCFSMRELKAHILAQNVRCHGILPMITGMLKSADEHDEEEAMRLAGHVGVASAKHRILDSDDHPVSTRSTSTVMTSSRRQPMMSSTASCEPETDSQRQGSRRTVENPEEGPWILQYVRGLSRNLCGFELAAEYGGISFGELVNIVFQETGALVVAVLDKRIKLCPQDIDVTTGLLPGTICFAIAAGAESLAEFRLKDTEASSWRTKMLQIRDQQYESTRRHGPHVVAGAFLGDQLSKSLLDPTVIKDDPDSESDVAPEEESEENILGAQVLAEDWLPELTGDEDSPSPPMPQLTEAEASPLSPPQTLNRPSTASVTELLSAFDPRLSLAGKHALFDGHFLPTSLPAVNRHWSGSTNGTSAPVDSRLPASLRRTAMELAATGSPQVNLQAADGEKYDVVERLREVRSNMKPEEELVVLLVAHGEVWQQVRTFVGALREDYMAAQGPIVIVTPTAMPPGLLDGVNNGVIHMQGSCTKAQKLFEAGVLEASAIVVMTGDVSDATTGEESADSIFKDSRVTMTAQVIECWCGISAREIFTTYELQESKSARHLPNLVLKAAMPIQEAMGWKINMVLNQVFGLASMRQVVSDGSMRPSTVEQTRLEEAESILFHPRFIAGQVFTPELWGAMLGRMYYMPATIELIEALVMPHRRKQTAYPWQIRPPASFVGRPYAWLVEALALCTWWMDSAESLIDATLLRPWGSRQSGRACSADGCESQEPTLVGRARASRVLRQSRRCSRDSLGTIDPQGSQEPGSPTGFARNSGSPLGSPHSGPRPSMLNAEGLTWKDMERKGGGPAVALALYRKRPELRTETTAEVRDERPPAQGTGGFNYIVLAAARNTTLRHDDWVLVLGSKRFGRRAREMDLLRGSCTEGVRPRPKHVQKKRKEELLDKIKRELV